MRETFTSENGTVYELYNVREKPFTIHGLYNPTEDGYFKRLPDELGMNVNEGIKPLYKHTAGGRVRFKTESSSIFIRAVLPINGVYHNMSSTGSGGLDVLEKTPFGDRIIATMERCSAAAQQLDKTVSLGNGEHEITVEMPSYSGLLDLFVGIIPGSDLSEHTPYRFKDPILYYGSSITQGAAASKPGCTYESIISRKFDTDYFNFGFSGSCKCEDNIVDYLSKQKCSIFVLDYDHNAPNLDYLLSTHEKTYKKLRSENPGLPIVFMTRPDFDFSIETQKRRTIIMKTYANNYEQDKNIYFVDGASFSCGRNKFEITADGCHPTDLGFSEMANGLSNIIEYLLSKQA